MLSIIVLLLFLRSWRSTLVVLLSLPAIVLTLGFFTLLINAFMLFLVTKIYPSFHLRSFWTAVVATVIIWIVNYLLTELLEPKHEKPIQ